MILGDLYNIFCDESCHLEKDTSNVMVLGAITCPNDLKRTIYNEIRAIKTKHGVNSRAELKWTKISESKLGLYLELLDYFFMSKELAYRGVVAQKTGLDHAKFNNDSYDLWYYKMYFRLLDPMIMPPDEYRIFIDIKDTCGGPKIRKLHDALCNSTYDFKKEIIKDIRQIDSQESELLQIVDIFNGALSFYHRGLYYKDSQNKSKKSVITHLMSTWKVSISKNTARTEQKFNVFLWKPRGAK